FEHGQYDSSASLLDAAKKLGETLFTPSLELLEILVIGKTEDIGRYQYLLQEFIKKYPDTDQSAYAKKLLDTSRKFEEAEEKRKGIQFSTTFDEPHYFVLVYDSNPQRNE